MPPIFVALIQFQVPRRENVIGPAGVSCLSLAQSPIVRTEGTHLGGSRERGDMVSWQHN